MVKVGDEIRMLDCGYARHSGIVGEIGVVTYVYNDQPGNIEARFPNCSMDGRKDGVLYILRGQYEIALPICVFLEKDGGS